MVGAPYEGGGSTENTGAVYIYYGRDTREEFQSQIPLKVHFKFFAVLYLVSI